MHVNDWDAIDQVRRVVGSEVDADRLADESVDLADLVTRPAITHQDSPGADVDTRPGHG